MANDISFSIQNPGTKPANQPELYMGQGNQLNFLFSNTLGIPNVNPGPSSQFSAQQNKVNLLIK